MGRTFNCHGRPTQSNAQRVHSVGIWAFISGLVSPVTDLIGKVVTKDEDLLKVEAALEKIKNEMASKLLDYETKLLDARTKVIVADAQGESWIQRCWRPITYLTILILIVIDAFGLTIVQLPLQAWTLLTIGLGGEIVGRACDKNIPHLANKRKPV